MEERVDTPIHKDNLHLLEYNQGYIMPLVRQTIINPKRKTILQYRELTRI